MPQQEDSIVSTFSSGTSESAACTAGIAPRLSDGNAVQEARFSRAA